MQPLHAYYARGEEQDRLESPIGMVEFLRTTEIVGRHLPAPPAVVADIGGGPGRYALWLAGQGHQVVHRDLMPLHVEQLGRAADMATIDSAVADARELDLDDACVDAVLLLGPLYHLDDRVDRIRALHEARRIVRPGGPVFVAAISRWASRLDGVLRAKLYDEFADIEAAVDEMERTGVMPPLHPGAFNGYAHRPAQLADEISAAGLELRDLVGVEGPVFLVGDLSERMDSVRDREVVLGTARALERVPDVMGTSPHLLVTAFRAG